MGNLVKYNSLWLLQAFTLSYIYVYFPISFQLTSPIFSNSFHKLLLTSYYSFCCLLAMISFCFTVFYGYCGLYTQKWRFGIRNHRWERTHNVSLQDWMTSLNIVFSISKIFLLLHKVSAFLGLNKIPLYVYHNFLIHFSVNSQYTSSEPFS